MKPDGYLLLIILCTILKFSFFMTLLVIVVLSFYNNNHAPFCLLVAVVYGFLRLLIERHTSQIPLLWLVLAGTKL